MIQHMLTNLYYINHIVQSNYLRTWAWRSAIEPPQKRLSFFSELEKLKNVGRILPDRF